MDQIRVSAQIIPFGQMSFVCVCGEQADEEEPTPVYTVQRTTSADHIEVLY